MSDSTVGNISVDEAEKVLQAEHDQAKDPRFHQGKEHSHIANDSKDQRTIANKLEREKLRENEPDHELSIEDRAAQIDPTLPARLHGNEPSKGAKIDAQIQAEEEEELRRKGKA
eukprot:TRINITY_DN336_c0_g3_i1.p1 TRINITY_DN336_c0_g3~~TRINITY_DN336_c0_g3_i1.p1  ORF type:complete len:114 (-),score=27.71 TRINITY_DN336_c0_g3_i1:132-473(-)